MSEVLVLLSGGIDSTVLVASLRPRPCRTVTFDYGQRSRHVELPFAATIAKRYGAAHTAASIDPVVFSTAALLDSGGVVPKFATLDEIPEGVPDVYVPGRNTVLLAHAVALAVNLGIELVMLGATAEDAAFPDCTRRYIDAFNDMLQHAVPTPVRVRAPFLHMTKSEVVALGRTLAVDFASTTSCYNVSAEGKPCGHCEACLRREHALCTT